MIVRVPLSMRVVIPLGIMSMFMRMGVRRMGMRGRHALQIKSVSWVYKARFAGADSLYD